MSSRQIFAVLFGILVPALLPLLQFGIAYRFWTSHKKIPVNKETCTCSCWDTIFKGTYQSGNDAPGYKHVYFNVTWQSFLIWSITVAFIIFLYESTKYLVTVARNGKLGFWPVIIFLASLYPNYYTWWSYFNVWNDDFYDQFFHQTLFSLTEAISTVLVLPMCDGTRPPQPRHLVVIVAVALLHIVASGYDQFVKNVLLQNGEWHRFSRDVAFMASDLIIFGVACLELRRAVTGSFLSSVRQLLTVKETAFAVSMAAVFALIVLFT